MHRKGNLWDDPLIDVKGPPPPLFFITPVTIPPYVSLSIVLGTISHRFLARPFFSAYSCVIHVEHTQNDRKKEKRKRRIINKTVCLFNTAFCVCCLSLPFLCLFFLPGGQRQLAGWIAPAAEEARWSLWLAAETGWINCCCCWWRDLALSWLLSPSSQSAERPWEPSPDDAYCCCSTSRRNTSCGDEEDELAVSDHAGNG